MYIVAGIMHFLVTNMAMLIVARALVGAAGRASNVLTPMYLGEISSLAIRRSIGTMLLVSVLFEILASILLELPYSTNTKWRFIYAPPIKHPHISVNPCTAMKRRCISPVPMYSLVAASGIIPLK